MSARTVRQADGLDPVRALQRVLYRSAKQDRTRRFRALFDKLARSDVMWRAWVDVATNRGAPGVDGVTVTSIADGGAGSVRVFLDGLAGQLKAGTYRPKPLRRVHIPKPGRPGESRPLGIPTVADRVVMTAVKIVLEPIFEADFLPASYGFRPKRSATQALEAVRQAANRGRPWVLDAASRRVSTTSTMTPSWVWSNAGLLTGGC
jgi:RNA-directed DNA polymerase